MTIIVATTFAVYGDRRITSSDGAKCEPMCKLASNHAIVAGFAGDYGAILRCLDAVRAGEDDPKELAKLGADGLIVKEGRIWCIDAKRAWLKPRRVAMYATGTGYAEAMAFLSGRQTRGKGISDREVRDAIKYVSRVRDDCGNGVDCIQAV